MYEDRRKKLYGYMLEAGFDRAIVGEPLTFYYLTGVMLHPYERFMGLVADASRGESWAVVPSVDSGCMRDSSVQEHVYGDSEGPSKVLGKLLRGGGRTGIEASCYTMRTGEMLKSLGGTFEDVSDVIALARVKKDPYEIEQIRLSAKCADDALSAVRASIKPGASEKEVVLALLCEMARTPSFHPDPFIIQILTGARSANPHGISGETRIARGDVITVDFCGYCNFYWSDFTRSLFMGGPDEINPELVKIYDIVHEANAAGIAAAKPGARASDVDRAARSVISAAGYGDRFIHRTGHGLGLNVHEAPNITSVNDGTILEEGMVFTVEPGIYLPGLGGVRIEDDVRVTENGCEVFNSYTKKREEMFLYEA
jgi:Xaa-Pro dipeptidase